MAPNLNGKMVFHLFKCEIFLTIAQARKTWQRFREIPEWIDSQIKSQPDDEIRQLEDMRLLPGKANPCSMNALSTMIATQRKEVCLSFQSC